MRRSVKGAQKQLATRATQEVQPADAGTGKVPALSKAIAILRYLNSSPRLSAGVTELSDALGLSKSHCFNILRALEGEGWVYFDAERRRYDLSARILTDFSRLLARSGPLASLHDELVRLSLQTRLPCLLSRIEPDGSFIVIDKAEEAAELLVSVPVGHHFPADAPAQMRVRLGWAEAEERKAAMTVWKPTAYTPTTIIDKAVLRKELDVTRSRGYAISRSEYTTGVTSLAAPIFDGTGHVALVVQCPGLESDVLAREREIAEALMEAAERMGSVLIAAPNL
jgi:DNA-binding IclR family transcriptional regulator